MILASASPRRKELMRLITEDFRTVVPDTDETSDERDPKKLVCELARRKARSVANDFPGETVIGADTVVDCGGRIFGKPASEEDARRMLRALSGRSHFVHTGVCVIRGGETRTEAFSTEVTFFPLSGDDIGDYLRRETVADKAGAYAIQGIAARFVEKIDGCFFNVVGLPVSGVYRMLKDLGAVK